MSDVKFGGRKSADFSQSFEKRAQKLLLKLNKKSRAEKRSLLL
jgi:hypothetical protein